MNKNTIFWVSGLLIVLFLVITTIFLVCLYSNKTVTLGFNYDINDYNSSVDPFLDAGCINDGQNYITCKDTKITKDFGCLDSLYLAKASLEFGTPLYNCDIPVYSDNDVLISDAEKKEYFECGGGLLQLCKSYIFYDNNKSIFSQIKNKDAFLSFVGDINSKEKALALVLLFERGYSKLTIDNKVFNSKLVSNNDESYLVTVYNSDKSFGCYDTINYESIVYKVTPLGNITEESRKIIYSERLPYELCVD